MDELNVSNQVNENEVMIEGDEYRKWLKKNTEIKGWLLLFLFVLAIGGIVTMTSFIKANWEETSENLLLLFGDLIFNVGYLAIVAYTIYAFWVRKPNALFYARACLIISLISNVIQVIIILSLLKQNPWLMNVSGWEMLGPIIWGIVWLVFLSVSERVKIVLPKNYRRVNAVDWVIVAIITIVPIMLSFIGGITG